VPPHPPRTNVTTSAAPVVLAASLVIVCMTVRQPPWFPYETCGLALGPRAVCRPDVLLELVRFRRRLLRELVTLAGATHELNRAVLPVRLSSNGFGADETTTRRAVPCARCSTQCGVRALALRRAFCAQCNRSSVEPWLGSALDRRSRGCERRVLRAACALASMLVIRPHWSRSFSVVNTG
jgi:hypothetical protein